MIFHMNTLLPALEVNGMALLQEKPMVEVAFVVVYTFPAMFSAVFVHCKASSHLYAHTATLQIGVYGLVAYPLCTVLSMLRPFSFKGERGSVGEKKNCHCEIRRSSQYHVLKTTTRRPLKQQ